ncbi:MAG: UDP-N-acetylglucosamine 2-epimerase [Candidatus Omnitrophica bacterium]|nr:UDP-N-acetylglucosamine 2-epimerase [Candidatus Omnitrophota bacterium]
MNKRIICVFTGTRAEYGLLKPLMEKIKKDIEFELKIIASGTHLSPEFGLTYKEIERDGFKIDEKVEMLLSSDTPIGITKSIGLGLIGYASLLQRLQPDLAIILGDRFEALAFAIACYVARVPIAHLYGGETTEGVIDEGIRHAITKLSYFHFTSTEEYRKIVIQLGESPDRVFNVGALGQDNIRKMELLSKEELEDKLGVKFKKYNFLITYHPVTLEKESAENHIKNLIDALDEFEDVLLIFTKSNADTEGRVINKMIDEYVNKNPLKAVAFTSMGQLLYLSTMKYVDVVVGNSSSGIIEAPSFKVATVNIGDRQKGRIKAESIIDCGYQKESIRNAIKLALSDEFKLKIKNVVNPYGDGNTAERIVSILRAQRIDNIKKEFYKIKDIS